MKHLYMPYLCIALILSPLQPILCSKWQLPRLFSEVILFHAKTFGSSAVGLTGEGGSNWNIFKKVEIKSFGQNQNQNSRLWGPWRFVVFLFEPPNPAPDRRPAGDPDLSQNMSSENYRMFTMWMYRIFTMWMYRMFTMLLWHYVDVPNVYYVDEAPPERKTMDRKKPSCERVNDVGLFHLPWFP